MESRLIFWRFLLLSSTFVFPQLIGILLHFRLMRRSRWLAFAFGFLVPAVLFFYFVQVFFFEESREAQLNGVNRCGSPSVVEEMILWNGTAAQLIVSLPIQLYLLSRRSR
jgi:hypothetical protein